MEKKPINKKLIFWSILISLIFVSSLLSIELAGQVAYRIRSGRWLFAYNNPDVGLFIAHPWLVAVPKPGESRTEIVNKKTITISHNSLGFRGHEVTIQKGNNTRRIVVLGGSSTYCVKVSDNETWPYLLEKDLGTGWEVINLGVAGYSTVENLIQTALQIQELSPDIAVYYEGWNDIRNVHVKNLKSDYSDFHGMSQYDTINIVVSSKYSIITFIRYLCKTMLIPIKPMPDADAFSTNPDYRALNLYGRNLGSIIALCKNFHIIPIMVPQIMNYEALTDDKHNEWMPFLRNKDVKGAMKLYNEKLREVTTIEKAGFVNEVLEAQFLSNDFIDEGHFSYSGNEKFASILANFIRKQTPDQETR